MATPDILVWRSLLYVPANNPRFIEKAHTRGADGIILDLEDSVPAAERDAARAALPDAVAQAGQGGADVLVRINSADAEATQDINAGVIPGVRGVFVTKVRDPAHLGSVADRVAAREHEHGMAPGTVRLIPMIETAAAYFPAREIAKAEPRSSAMVLGGEDFAMDVGMVPGGDTLAMAKQQVCYAARAAGLMPLGLMGTVADFTDLEGVREAAERAHRFGMEGASCIHPSNVPILNAAFSPGPDAVDHAERVVAAYAEATKAGRGAITVDGKMIDGPVVRRAEKLLARWRAIEAREAAKE